MQPLEAHWVRVGQTFVQLCARSHSTTIPTTIEGIKVEEPIAKSKEKNWVDQRYEKRTLEGEVEERRKAWLPPYKMDVTKNGKIDGACDGNNEWDNALRRLAPWHYHWSWVVLGTIWWNHGGFWQYSITCDKWGWWSPSIEVARCSG